MFSAGIPETTRAVWRFGWNREESTAILAFDDPGDAKVAFGLRQFGDGLAMQRAQFEGQRTIIRSWLKTDHVFEEGKREVLTITARQGKTALYVDGRRAQISPTFGLVNQDLSGRLVLGNSPSKESWSGKIIGLAVYDFELAPTQVAEHFERWTHQQDPAANGEKAPLALYRFDEGKGNIVHDQSASPNDLVIASRYFALHSAFLHPPWDQFRNKWAGWMSWSYWADVLANVAGFVPLGFFFLAYFSLVRPVLCPRMVVVVLGLTVSLLIEILQHFLPTRDSSMTDVITNTVGTMAGVGFYRPAFILKAWNRLIS